MNEIYSEEEGTSVLLEDDKNEAVPQSRPSSHGECREREGPPKTVDAFD